MIAESKIASSHRGSGTSLNPGGFIPLAMKEISDTEHDRVPILKWVLFSVVSLLPLAVALILLAVSGTGRRGFWGASGTG